MSLGEAFVEVHADTRPFGRELRAEIRRLLKDAERSVSRDSEGIGRSIADGISEGVRKSGPSIDDSIRRTVGKTKIKKEVEVEVDNDSLTRAGGMLSRFVSSAASSLVSLGQTATKTFASIGGAAVEAVTGLGSAASNPYLLLIMTMLLALGGPAIVGGIIILGSVLWSLVGIIGLIPGIAVLAVAAILPLTIAFQGFSDAISAIISKDPKKIAEALEKLTPAARSVALEFQKMLPFFEGLKKAVQQSFFAQIEGQLTKLVNALGPSVTTMLTTVSTALGTFAAQIATALANPQVAQFLQELGLATASLIEVLGPALLSLFAAVGRMAQDSLPLLVQLGTSFAEGIQKFADFINSAVADGRFRAWLEQALVTLGKIWTIAKEFYNVLVTIFDEANTSGQDFLDVVAEALRKLSEFFQSREGKDAIKAMIALAEGFAGALLVATAVALGLLSVLGAVARAISGILRDLGIISSSGTVQSVTGKGGGSASSGGGTNKAYAEGGIVDRPTNALIGEAGREVVIPLTNPRRAAELATASGLADMLGVPTVTVYLGTSQITDILDVRVDRRLGQQARDLALGARPGV